MSRRPTPPDARGKRSHSFGPGSTSEKRTKRDEPERHGSSRDNDAPAGPSELRGGDNPPGDHPRYSSTTESSPASSPLKDDSRRDRGSTSRPNAETSIAEPSSSRSRPTWQTGPSESAERVWSTERETDGDRESRTHESREAADSGEYDHDQRPTSANPSHGLSPPGAASAGGIVQTAPQRTQAVFVNKLYSMLEDSRIAESGLLYWSQDGTSFVCPNPSEFARDVLPNYFKHNNWQSFVRQLNMYSFNKVSDLYSTANSDPQAWEFRHSKFLRGRPDLLIMIKRKPTRQNQNDTPPVQASPGEDQDKALSTWGAGPSHPVNYQRYVSPPPPREYRGGQYYPLNTTAPAAMRPMSSGYDGGFSRSPPRPHVLPSHSGRPMSHGAPYGPEPSRSEPPYYTHSQPPPSRHSSIQASTVETLNLHVASLQDNVYRMWSALQQERYDNASRCLDMTNHMIRMSDWVSEVNKVRIPVEMLHRQRGELINRIEVLQTQSSDMQPRPHTADHRPRSSYEPTAFGRSVQSSLHESHAPHSSYHELSSHVPDRVLDRVRPMTSDAALHYSGSVSTFSAPSSSHRFPPPAADFRYALTQSDERVPSRGEPTPRNTSQRRDADESDTKALDFDSKTSLRNLLH